MRERLGYANVMATLAVFLALGGTTLAVTLPKKSVGPKQLKRNAVTKKKIRAGAVVDEKISEGAVTGGKLATGAVTGAKLAGGAVAEQALSAGAVTTGKLANAAVTRAKISPGAIPLLGNVRSGQTLRGSFNIGGRATVAEDNARQGVSYAFPLAQVVPSTVIGLTDPTTPSCPSRYPPQASAGRLCVYVNGVGNVEGSTVSVENSGHFGFGIRVNATAANLDYGASGVWAVTGP